VTAWLVLDGLWPLGGGGGGGGEGTLIVIEDPGRRDALHAGRLHYSALVLVADALFAPHPRQVPPRARGQGGARRGGVGVDGPQRPAFAHSRQHRRRRRARDAGRPAALGAEQNTDILYSTLNID
jgi:hypothetical protein